MAVYLPCLNVDNKDSGSGYSVGAFLNPANVASIAGKYVLTTLLEDTALSFYVGPISVLISIAINYEFWKNLFGLGETRIDREKEAIQDVMTPIFRYLSQSYGVPITDNHALQFPSDGVKKQFQRRPEIAALVDYTASTDDYVANYVFAKDNADLGQEQRVSNQFLANASYNGWTVEATKKIWDGIVEAAKPECPDDKSRWVRNPEIVKAVAQVAAVKRYVTLDVLLDYATHNALGTTLATEIVKQWGDNPDLVKDLPTNLEDTWSYQYKTFDESYFSQMDELGNVIPLFGRDGIGYLVNTIKVALPTYPDFTEPSSQGGSGSGGGQGGTGNGGTQGGGNGGSTDGGTDGGGQGGGGGGDQGGGSGGTQNGGSGGTQGNGGGTQGGDGGTQGGGDGGDQGGNGGTQSGDGLTETQRFNYACRIVYKLVNKQTLTADEYDWILTNEGSTAVTDAYRDPDCNPSLQGTYDPDLPTTDDCPTVPQDDGGGDQGTDGPGDQGDGDGGDQDQDCMPKCQEQIDILKEKQEECCDFVQEVIVPEIKLILEWLTDIEYRVEGQLPTLPPSHEPFTPPTDPGDKPKKDEPDEPTGTTPTEPPFPPEVMDCLAKLCAPGEIPKIVKENERQLECIRMDACDLGVRIAGALAECWLRTHTANPANVEGEFRGWTGPQQILASLRAVAPENYSRGAGTPTGPRPLGWQGAWRGASGEYGEVCQQGSSTAMLWGGPNPTNDTQPIPVAITTWPYVFSSPEDQNQAVLKVRSVKPRADELDPCDESNEGTAA